MVTKREMRRIESAPAPRSQDGSLRSQGAEGDPSDLENPWRKQSAISTRRRQLIRNWRQLNSEHAAQRLALWARGTMLNGRSEKRIARAVSLEVCLQDETTLKARTVTENVSAHGARVLMSWRLKAGQQVLVSSPREDVRSQAQVVYCQPLAENGFAVGLELSSRVELWGRRY